APPKKVLARSPHTSCSQRGEIDTISVKQGEIALCGEDNWQSMCRSVLIRTPAGDEHAGMTIESVTLQNQRAVFALTFRRSTANNVAMGEQTASSARPMCTYSQELLEATGPDRTPGRVAVAALQPEEGCGDLRDPCVDEPKRVLPLRHGPKD